MWVQSLGWEEALEEGMATHFNILAWRIPWTEEPGLIQGHKQLNTTEAPQHACMHILLHYGLLQDIENSSLRCIVEPCDLHILSITVCIC